MGVGCIVSLPLLAQDATVTLGKQFAAASPLEWDVQEASHPKLGKIRFAYLKNLVETPVGNAKVYSRAYVSCDPTRRKIAIELTNTTSPDDPGGLRPKTLPRLVCSRLATPNDTTPIKEELLAPRWEVSKIGDVLAHSLTAFPLRECVSIEVLEDVELPKGWAQPSAAVTFEITPYNKQLDEIFASCGEVSAYAQPATAVAKAPAPGKAAPPAKAAAPAKAPPPAPPKQVAQAPVPASTPPATTPAPATTPPPPPPPSPAPAPATKAAPSDGWQQARAVATGRTNVRAGPTLQSGLVVQLDPGMPVLAQKAEADWWRVRTTLGGKPIEGYVRQDRLVFK
ncbi:hypothetical protein DSM104443_03135 [Usitatibacter rugosus]|uniref:SH3 domain-containing protein n=2 Tax=Usitatibacter rugosus TaxID=2732067 RepID=A0A6M4GYF6_9PROT|nr:hypothetical protein DSM104443_03135 [Usitatibacter rugosus]